MRHASDVSPQAPSRHRQGLPNVKVTLRQTCINFFTGLTPEAEDFNLEQAITALSALLAQYPSVHALDLSVLEGILGNTHLQVLAGALKHNQTLTSLDLGWNKIGPKGAGHLGEALTKNQTLTCLNLFYNEIGSEGAGHLGVALSVNQTLTSLDLCCNKIGSKGARHLGEALTKNQTLISLNLRSNQSGAEGAEHLGDGLSKNQTLTSLDLGGNKIGPKGAQYIRKLFQVNKILISVNLANNKIDDKPIVHEINQALRRNHLHALLGFLLLSVLSPPLHLDVLFQLFRDEICSRVFPGGKPHYDKVKAQVSHFRAGFFAEKPTNAVNPGKRKRVEILNDDTVFGYFDNDIKSSDSNIYGYFDNDIFYDGKRSNRTHHKSINIKVKPIRRNKSEKTAVKRKREDEFENGLLPEPTEEELNQVSQKPKIDRQYDPLYHLNPYVLPAAKANGSKPPRKTNTRGTHNRRTNGRKQNTARALQSHSVFQGDPQINSQIHALHTKIKRNYKRLPVIKYETLDKYTIEALLFAKDKKMLQTNKELQDSIKMLEKGIVSRLEKANAIILDLIDKPQFEKDCLIAVKTRCYAAILLNSINDHGCLSDEGESALELYAAGPSYCYIS